MEMDNRPNSISRVKPLFAYLKESAKFYDTRNPFIAQIIFVLELAVIFGGNILAKPYTDEFAKTFEQINVQIQSQLQSNNLNLTLLNSELFINLSDSLTNVLLIMLAINSVSFIVGLFYGTYYYFSLTDPSIKDSRAASIFFRRLPKLIMFNILFYCIFFIIILVLMLVFGLASVFVSFFAFFLALLPMIFLILNALFIFKDLLIIEYNIGILRNFKKAWDITKDSRRNIILNGLWPVLTGWLLSTLAADLRNQMLSMFIAAFIDVIIVLMTQRLAALMFIDAASLERHDKKTESNTKSIWPDA
jgi:hypothetical protein